MDGTATAGRLTSSSSYHAPSTTLGKNDGFHSSGYRGRSRNGPRSNARSVRRHQSWDKTQDGSDENFDPPQPDENKPKEIEDKPEPIETFVEEEADYPGGAGEMAKFINENIDYPQEAIDLGIKGRVTVRFVVEKDGRVSNVSVAGPLAGCKACDKAAVQVVEKMPPWTAGKNGGRAVRTWVTLPIKFEVN